jgi:UTP--glucose-1-phosphate uridylyltransferase
LEEFKSVRKFKIFNTNNLWLNLPALKRVMETENLDLEIIINQKSLDDSQPVIQLETAAGAAIKHFKGAHGVNVPRNRFLPVKSCSDLLLIKSDIYSLEHGQLVINPSRMFENTPVIKLGDHFKKVSLTCLALMKSLLSFTTRQSLTFLFFSFLFFSFLFYADPTVPETVQEDTEDY